MGIPGPETEWEIVFLERKKKRCSMMVVTGVNRQDRSGLVKGVESGIDQAD